MYVTLPSKHLLLLKTSWRRRQHVFSVTILRLARRLEDVMNTSWRRLAKTFWRRLEDLLQDVLKTSWKTKNCYAEDVLKTSWRHVLKTSWRCLEDMSWRPLKNFMETNKIFTGDICTTLKRIQNALISDDWFGLKLA